MWANSALHVFLHCAHALTYHCTYHRFGQLRIVVVWCSTVMLLCHLISTRIASFRVVSQSSPPATIQIVVFLNFEYSFYSFFSVFFCTCEGFFFVSGLKSTLWAIMALWAILALWFFWMFFNSFSPHVRGFFYSFFPHVRVKF